MGRLYEAVQVGTEMPVVIKEFVLPRRYFNGEEMRQRQEAFVSLAGVALADGRSQDLRLISPWEAIADDREERCYLVTLPPDASPTLNQVLVGTGAMSVEQVRLVLNQVLQTLEFLHQQKFALPMGQVQTGLMHGNLNLNSLVVMKGNNSEFGTGDFIYLCDLLLWERLFEPFQIEVVNGSVAKDLMALGMIAFHLLVGRATDEKGQLLQPKDDRLWAGIDPLMKKYVLRLLELDLPFENAAEARRTLLQMPIAPVVSQFSPDAEVLEKKKPLSNIVKALIIALLLAAFGKLAMTLIKPAPAAEAEPPICCMKEVGGMPIGEYTYTAVGDGTWDKFLNQTGLAGVPKGQRLKEYLATTQPQLKLNYQSVDSVKEAIAKVRSGKAAFAIVPMIKELPDDLMYQEFARDALAVFVNFSYSEREKGLPTALQGQLTLEQLQDIYSGKTKDWQELSRSNLPLQRYAPLDGESIALFEQKVLGDQRTIATFRELLDAPKVNFDQNFIRSKNSKKIEQLPTLEMLRTSIQDFEAAEIGGIGFAPFSQVLGQCSVYPLALGKEGRKSIQALTLTDGKAIDPALDLCDRKGSYGILPELVKSGQYPLSYGIAIVYTRDNSRSPVGEKFAEMLKSTEGQKLLSQFGLMPF
jgi:PBP superfamily domain